LNSLASYLPTLIPDRQPAYFLSLFHNPAHGYPSNALRHELDLLASLRQQDEDVFQESFSNFLEILPSERGTPSIEDASRCLRAAADFDTARELYILLTDLDSMGPVIMHSPSAYKPPIPPPTPTIASPILKHQPISPLHPPSLPSTPVIDSSKNKSQQYSWTTVTNRRQPPTISTDPLGEYIPAYRHMPEGWREKSGRLANEPEPTLEDEESEDKCREWVDYYKSKRNEALQSASQNWKVRGSTGRGEAAFHYASEVSLLAASSNLP
jgi:hypothetical protein